MVPKANVFGEVEISDFALAALLSCDGYALVRCTSSLRDEDTIWTFRGIPECDLEIYLELIKQEDTQVPLLGLMRGMRTIQAAQKHARKTCGEWRSEKGWFSQDNK